MRANSVKHTIKSIRDSVLATKIVRSAMLPPGSLTILTYHRVLPQSLAKSNIIEPGMFVTPETFDMHLQIAKQNFTPIRIQDWLHLSETAKQTGERYVALTLDDGWYDNFDFAFERISAHAFPATIFLVPQAVDDQLVFWSDKLALLYRDDYCRSLFASSESIWVRELGMASTFFRHDPSQERLARLVLISKQLPDDVMQNELTRISVKRAKAHDDQDEERYFMNWKEIGEMADSGLVDFGSHSNSHLRLDRIDDERTIDAEVLGSQTVLRENLGEAFCDIFCYPNGSVGELAENRVREHYAAACTTVRGVNLIGEDRYQLRRMSVHEDATANKRSFLSNLVRS